LFRLGDYQMEPVVAVLSNYEENAKWLIKHHQKLKTKFNNEWVAVLNKTIIDHDRNLNKLVKRLRKKHPKAYSQIPIEYITTKEIELIL
jgi:hypothetical protein